MSEANKKTAKDEILDVYKGIRNFLLDNEEYFKQLVDIENKDAAKEKAVGIATTIAKCFLNFFSCDIAGTLLEGTRDIVGSLKGDKNEIQGLSAAYDNIVKKHNNYYEKLKVKKNKGFGKVNVYGYNKQKDCYYKKEKPEVEIARLKTTSEMLEEIYNKYGIERKSIKGRKERRKLSEAVAAHFKNLNDINNEKKIAKLENTVEDLKEKLREQAETLKEQKERFEKQEKRLLVFEETNKRQEILLKELMKNVEILNSGKEKQIEQQKMLEAMKKEHPQIQQIVQQTNVGKIQTPQKAKEVHAQNLSDRFKGLEMIEISEAKDAEEEQIRTPLATGTSNEVAAKSQIVENRAEEDSEIEDNRISDTEDIKEENKKAKPKQFQDLPDRPKNVVRLKLPKRNDTIKEEEIQISLKSQSLDSGIAHLRDKNKRVKEAHKEIEAKTQKRGLASKSMP